MDIDTNSLEGPKPHDILWFPDGNIVLKTDTYLFKVYKGLLSMNSSFFRDMFELPHVGGDGSNVDARQGGSGGVVPPSELYEGLPIVTMVDDDGEDVAHLLRAIYQRSYYDRHNNDTPLDTIVALLKLSAKYDFNDIRKDIIIQISSLYPSTPEEVDSFEEEDASMFGEGQLDCHTPLLAAAFQANADILLPILYFNSSSVAITDILNDAKFMSPDCFSTLIKGREELEAEMCRAVAGFPDYLSKAMSSSGCSERKPCLITARFSHLPELIHGLFHGLQGQKVVETGLSSVCAKCGTSVARLIDEKREEIWKNVPSYFNCPGWDVIQEKLEEIKNSW